MKFVKAVITAMSVLFILNSFSAAQDMKMMKQDSAKKDMMMKDKTMGGMMSDKNMMKDNMMRDGMMMKINKDMNGVAIKGYDPVAYFEDHKAEMGDKMYSYEWMGATWHFKNEKHKKMFVDNPEMYAPQFGGYCAFGASMDHLSAADPTAWTIRDGKLYLSSNAGVAKRFNEDAHSCIMKANENWHDLNMHKDKGGM